MNKRIFRAILIGYILQITLMTVNGQTITKSNQFETRCGWYSNPTPSNHSLYDKDGDWLIGAQGGYQAKGDGMPNFKTRQWVITNGGSYGYGCACLRLKIDEETGYVSEIKSSYAKPLSACRRDKALKRWQSLFN